MSWGMIGSAVIGAGVGLYSANKSAKAAEKSAQAQADAALETAKLQDEAQKRFEARMQPYTDAGSEADRYITGMLGLPHIPSSDGQPRATPYGQMYTDAELRQQYPTEAAQWDSWERAEARKGNSQTNRHRDLYGDFVGYIQRTKGIEKIFNRTADATTPSTAAQQIERNRSDAMAAYEASPWARFAAESAETSRNMAEDSFQSTAGARGSLVSGRTAAGLYDISQRAEDQRFREGFTDGWYPSITAVSDRGYNASVGVGDNSLSTAARVGAAGERAAQATAQGQQDADEAWANGVNSALYYGGQAWDALTNRNSKPAATTGTGKTPVKKTAAAHEAYHGG